jgi:glycosyltransferase involved in cell wall biosynthesis
VPFDSLGMSRGIPDPIAAVRLLRIIRRTRPDILQTWMYHADLLGLLVGKLTHVPTILWNLRCSSMDAAHSGWVSSLVRRALISLSPYPDAVLANSQAGLHFHQTLGYRPQQWVLIPNSLDLAHFRPDAQARVLLRQELGLSANARVIGLVARYHPVKDHPTFISAAEQLANRDPNTHFVLVGMWVNSENTQLMQLIESTGFRQRFHLLDQRLDVAQITAGLDIACSSSSAEGLSNTIIEAMACGVPCVVTNVGDSALVVGDIGKVVPPKEPQAFARACEQLLNVAPGERLELGRRARKRIEERFSLPSIVALYERLYEQVAFSPEMNNVSAA